jgi:hypothetical protein
MPAPAFICDDNGIHPSHTTVGAGSAGVEIVVDNRTGVGEEFEIDRVGGRNAPPGVHAIEGDWDGFAFALAPGDYTVKCVPDSVTDPKPVEGATLTVSDSDEFWVSDRLECSSNRGVASNPDFVTGGESLDAAAHEALDGYASPGDVLQRVGYPDAELPEFALVRSGRNIMLAEIRPTPQGKWLPEEIHGCSESRTKGGFHAPIEPPATG